MQTTYRATALELMLDALPAIKAAVDTIRRHDKNLADQIRRAATSVALNLAEADGSNAGHVRARIITARGSLAETRCALRVAVLWDYVPSDEVARIDAMLDRVAAMSWRRLRRQR